MTSLDKLDSLVDSLIIRLCCCMNDSGNCVNVKREDTEVMYSNDVNAPTEELWILDLECCINVVGDVHE